MSQIGAWLENLRNQKHRSYGLARAFFVQRNVVQSLHEKGMARVIQGGRVHRGCVEVYYPLSGPSENGGESGRRATFQNGLSARLIEGPPRFGWRPRKLGSEQLLLVNLLVSLPISYYLFAVSH